MEVEAVFAAKQGRGDGDAEGDGLAGAGLGGDQEVGALGFRRQNAVCTGVSVS